MAKICKTNINLNLEIYEKTHTHTRRNPQLKNLKKCRWQSNKKFVIPIARKKKR